MPDPKNLLYFQDSLSKEPGFNGKMSFQKGVRIQTMFFPLLPQDSACLNWKARVGLGFDGDTKCASTRSSVKKGTLSKCGVPVAETFSYS